MISRTIFFRSAQASVIRWRAELANAGHLAQPVRLGLDGVEHPLPKRLDHFSDVNRPDPTDHPRAQVLLDAVDRGRREGRRKRAQKCWPRVWSLTKSPEADPFPGGDDGRVADGRD
jgi:hypothetical protein